jgi:hypothetical protein
MLIVKKLEQYDSNSIFFCEPIKNNVMSEGTFIRIIYSNNNINFNGIYLLLTINDIICEKYYNKYKCTFNIINNKHIIDSVKVIEEEIIKKYSIENKIPQFKLHEQLKNCNIKVLSDIGNKNSYSFILKISGIWETNNNYGLTYKFIIPTKQ